jgi:uncharacterized membrane protein
MASSGRRPYIDWARGVAVLIMIEAHVLDSWTSPVERGTRLFGYLNLLSGYAAPLFLWLAGLSLVLAADRDLSRRGDRHAAATRLLRRGALVFLLAFLFRLQAFIVSPGNPLVSLLRVDILNIMGPSMIAVALLWRVAPGPRAVATLCGIAAALIALVTPIVRDALWVGHLPALLQWYMSPAGNHSTFTLFPWSGFVFAGASFGALLGLTARATEATALRRLAAAGAALGLLAAYASTRPSIYASSAFWTTSPAYFAIRVALLMLLLAGLYWLTPIAAHVTKPFDILERFGRHSLFVYWIHVELVYGYATLPIHHRLPLWGTGIGFVLFASAMYGAIALKDRIVSWWRSRAPGGAYVETVRA